MVAQGGSARKPVAGAEGSGGLGVLRELVLRRTVRFAAGGPTRGSRVV
jgi:hypothetical protein